MSASEAAFKKQQEEAERKVKEQVERVEPVIYALLGKVVESKPSIEVKDRKDFIEKYEAVTVDCLKALKESGLTIAEIEYGLPKLEQVVGALKQQILMSLNKSADKVLEKTFGKEFKDMTMNDWDEILLKTVEPKEVKQSQE